MPFKKAETSFQPTTDDNLTADLIAIGMRLSGKPSQNPSVEQTLISASMEGILRKDGRVMSLLTDWITIHFERINIDRLYQLLKGLDPSRYSSILIYWAATAQRLSNDPRFKKMESLYCGPRMNYGRLENEAGYDDTDFLIERNGEDHRFKNTCLRVPYKTLRERPRDILSPREVALQHEGYRSRILFGSNVRADLWLLLKQDPSISAADLARKGHCSYTAARSAKMDFDLVRSLRKPRKSKAA